MASWPPILLAIENLHIAAAGDVVFTERIDKFRNATVTLDGRRASRSAEPATNPSTPAFGVSVYRNTTFRLSPRPRSCYGATAPSRTSSDRTAA
jgi:hypothetical protein